MGALILSEVNRTILCVKNLSEALLKKLVSFTARVLTLVAILVLVCTALVILGYGAYKVLTLTPKKHEKVYLIRPSEYGIGLLPSRETSPSHQNPPINQSRPSAPLTPARVSVTKSGLDLRSTRNLIAEASRFVRTLSNLTR